MKKLMTLSLAVVALAACSLPAMARAEVWTDGGVPIEADDTVFETGPWIWQGGAAGTVECQMTLEYTVHAGQTTAQVKKVEVDLDQAGSTVTQKCKGAGGMAFCQIHAMEAQNLPWTMHNVGPKAVITVGGWKTTLTGGFCPVTTITITAGEVTATPDNPSGISSFTHSGTLQGHLSSGGSVSGNVSGKFDVLAPDTGTFGL
jgi:hypothetical protein